MCSSKWMTRERKVAFSKACSNVPGQSSIAPWKHLSGPASIQKWSHFKDTMFSWTVCPICPSVELWVLKHFPLTERRKSPECFLITSQTCWSCEWQSLVRNTGIPLVTLGVNVTWHHLCMKGTVHPKINQKIFFKITFNCKFKALSGYFPCKNNAAIFSEFNFCLHLTQSYQMTSEDVEYSA